jgi:hypothetical protein
MPGAAGRTAAVLLPQSGLTAKTADPFDHGCQVAAPCARTGHAMNGRALPGECRPLRTVASAEITPFAKLKSQLPKTLMRGRIFSPFG